MRVDSKKLVAAEVSASFVEVVDDKKIYRKFQVSLGVKIEPRHFGKSDTNYRYDNKILNKHANQNGSIKVRMNLFEKALIATENFFLLDNYTPTVKEFKEELSIRFGLTKRKEISTNPSISSFLKAKIECDEKNIGSQRKDAISEQTIKLYRTLALYVDNYETVTKTKLLFENLNVDLWWKFWDTQDDILRGKIQLPVKEGRRKQTVKEYGFAVNSIRKYQTAFIKVLRLAQADNIPMSLDLNDKTLVLKAVPSHKDFYINEGILQEIINYSPDSEALREAKEYILLACLTGMRYQSMAIAHISQIKQCVEHDYNFYYIHSHQGKTKTDCHIPLLKPVLDILDRHGNRFPKFSQNAVINRNIKELFEVIDINVVETIHSFKDGLIKKKRKINELVSSHDFRKSFYTNLILLKVNDRVIDNITHPDKPRENSMANTYNKATMLDKAKMFVDEIKMVNSDIYSF